MATITPNELLSLWTREKITIDMAIGHILQNLVDMQRAYDARNITMYNLRADVDSLIAHTGMKPNPKGNNKPPQKG
ncbi:MAG TPA: hypothetical protein VEC93_02995 [Anaerolineae bacterium]|nr:hypothetical protein [Anaerolineae bacterium]